MLLKPQNVEIPNPYIKLKNDLALNYKRKIATCRTVTYINFKVSTILLISFHPNLPDWPVHITDQQFIYSLPDRPVHIMDQQFIYSLPG
jgi:hypothetical protein